MGTGRRSASAGRGDRGAGAGRPAVGRRRRGVLRLPRGAGAVAVCSALTTMGEMSSFGYLATPPPGADAPGILVIQEWWGLMPHIKNVADRFAGEGFVALAPDLYRGASTTEPDEA